MKTFSLFALASASVASAFPSILEHLESQKAPAPGLKKRVLFDAKSQLINVTGPYAFNPPGKGDQRGPCPGLNAMANHGYLPHNGVGTITDFIESTTKVFGMGADLAAFLAVYGAVIDGNGLQWSIGGPTANVPSINLLSPPRGISASHNKYEGDNSPTRGDLYLDGQDYLLTMKNFQALYDAGKAEDNYDIQVLTDQRAKRFQQNIDENPYFFNAPFSGVIAQPAAWAFVYRFMGNKSAEYPEGRLNGEVLKSFYAITGEDGHFTYTPGYERIPENWYTRNIADPYTIPSLVLDTDYMALQHPEFLAVGGNTGTTNSFTGVNPENLTDGVYNAKTLTQGNNLFCFGTQVALQQLPDLLTGVVSDLTGAINQLSAAFGAATNTFSCPQLTKFDDSQFSQFPGYTKLKSDGTY